MNDIRSMKHNARVNVPAGTMHGTHDNSWPRSVP